MTEKVKNILSFLGRLGLSFGLLAWIFSFIKWNEIISVVKTADVGLLWWAGLVYMAINVLVLIRWYIFMRALGLDVSVGLVCRYFFIGSFCNLFLPTSIGGDLVKAIGLSRGVGQKPKVFASVVLDRLSGFAGLVIVAAIAYMVGSRLIDAPSVVIPILVLTALSLVIGGMLFNAHVYRFFGGLVSKFPRIQKGIMEMHEDVMLMQGKKRTGWGCVAFSCFLQVLGAYMAYLIALGLHQDVHFLPFLVFTPIVAAVTFLPSIGGLGVREIGWVYFLGKIGVAQGIAVGLSLISFFYVVILGLIGGIVYVTTAPARRVQYSEADA
ncbi:MAG: flippase-like domain-containing protein [Candidatus Omnitrophica bacterium]|nr:flippase-like domain-containing protein [Candidatus Omnitrophota bacterium]